MSSFEGISAAEIAEELKAAGAESRTEEDFKIRAEYILRVKAFEKIGVKFGRYEYTLVSGVRPDALYGHVIIEYEAPGTLSTQSGFYKAVEQTKRYIMDEAKVEKDFARYFGIIIDGQKIAFVRYRRGEWVVQGPFDITRHTILRLLEALRGLQRKPLRADLLIVDLGPKSPVARRVVKTLYKKLKTTSNLRVIMLFDDWKRVFSQVCAYSPDKLKGLEEEYGLTGEVDYEALLFAIHTYYALVMKLLAAEVAVLYGDSLLQSYFRKLEDAFLRGPDKLRDELAELEEGGIFRKIGIMNFLEADYFAWYLDVWDDELADAVRELVKVLSDYEPGTAELEPEVIRDLFKRLYQHLVPKKIRHDLGEYYTPDWLAELVLNEVGFTLEAFEELREKEGDPLAPLRLRLLDPACGSGTFLVLAIKRLKDYCEEHFVDRGTALEHITRNVVGFDLNPLAVIAARTNYLLALGDYIRYRKGDIELPVYLADSILVERRTTLTGETYILRATVGEFSIPISVIEHKILDKVLALVEECARLRCSLQIFRKRLSQMKVNENDLSILSELYKKILDLEGERKDKIWLRVLKNSFAPLLLGKFDFVVGNPPWVNWENLPIEYRKASSSLWEKYGLKARATAKQFELGKMRRDISMLFLYVCADRYLKDGGMLGFLITQMVFKTKGAEVFRKFMLPDKIPLKVLKVHDMVELRPFEDAANMTSMIILRKGEPTEYPIPYVQWSKKARIDLSTANLQEVLAGCVRRSLLAIPVDATDDTSQWLTVEGKLHKVLSKVTGHQQLYKAHAGVYSGGANGVYWIKILDKTPSGRLIIENLYNIGKRKVNRVQADIEPDLVYKLVRTRDLKKWLPKPEYYIVVPHTKHTDWQAIPPSEMMRRFPRTYAYLLNFRNVLLNRAAYKLLRKGHPFYIMMDIHSESFAEFKVAWKRMGNKISAAVLEPMDDPYIGRKPLIPQETISFIPASSRDEAHYLCAILNSSCVDLLVRSFSQYRGKSFATPSILKYINIPIFDPNNNLHKELVRLSKRAHELARVGAKNELKMVEEQIDRIVAKIYGITDEELVEIKRNLLILDGRIDEAKALEKGPAHPSAPVPKEPTVEFEQHLLSPGEGRELKLIVSNPFEDRVMKDVVLEVSGPGMGPLTHERKSMRPGTSWIVPIKVPPLEEGEHEVSVRLTYTVRKQKKMLEKTLRLYVKKPEEKPRRPRGAWDELLGELA